MTRNYKNAGRHHACVYAHGRDHACVYAHGRDHACVYAHGRDHACVYAHGRDRACVYAHGRDRACVYAHGRDRACVYAHGRDRACVYAHGRDRACARVFLDRNGSQAHPYHNGCEKSINPQKPDYCDYDRTWSLVSAGESLAGFPGFGLIVGFFVCVGKRASRPQSTGPKVANLHVVKTDMEDHITSIEKLIAPQVNVATLLASARGQTPRTQSGRAQRQGSLDSVSLSSSDTTSLIYKLGSQQTQEHSIDSMLAKTRSLPRSIASLGSSLSISEAAGDSSYANILNPDRPISSKPLRVVSGAQFRLLSKQQPVKCEHCDHFERLHRKDKESIRGLKVQIARLEEALKDIKFSKTADLPASVSTPKRYSEDDQDDLGVDDPEAMRRLQSLEDELSKVKRLLSFERSTAEALRQGLEQHKINTANETQRLSRDLEKATADLAHSRAQHAKVKNETETLNVRLADSERELQRHRKQLQDALLRLQAAQREEEEGIDTLHELQSTREALQALQEHTRVLEHTVNAKSMSLVQAEDQLAVLTQQLRNAQQEEEAGRASLAESQVALRSSQEGLAAAKKRLEALEGSLKLTIQERDATKQTVSQLSDELATAQKRIASLETDLQTSQQKLNEALRRMALESAATKKALEKAVTASVRLCVVAPTVNVNIGEQRQKYRSRLSEKALEKFLDDQVFSRYAMLFKQDQENTGPDGELSMEKWLQGMLAKMQTTIESHVNAAMEGSSL
eukprot:gene6346-6998_t